LEHYQRKIASLENTVKETSQQNEMLMRELKNFVQDNSPVHSRDRHPPPREELRDKNALLQISAKQLDEKNRSAASKKLQLIQQRRLLNKAIKEKT
jgi:hypothetical protein